mmetsp:Transcript_22444/g.37133  ORF Transcript_22444/g.37133 Transcript_22444/m.37133 type:complete len:105 (+) Transcript_22444:122-436(+)|eukprot:CAMPEP_0119005748 /NCGR_PEP_ID=MMETSP1176-20130426/1903_1 /TAXON_ID=265551 /ORGANISM="Synedropsis recta cf, Strain CCMP1620" /LENGTH=104 /DNA_ID=CAMNT_0006957589 /DNA_START=93 /DNA_END=407 /DNA_ORIENTATION=+
MRSLFTVVLLSLALFVKAEEGKKSSYFGHPWYADFLEEFDTVEKPSTMTSKRRKGTEEKPKEISAKKTLKKVPANAKDGTTDKAKKRSGWFSSMSVDELTESLE